MIDNLIGTGTSSHVARTSRESIVRWYAAGKIAGVKTEIGLLIVRESLENYLAERERRRAERRAKRATAAGA